MHHENMILSALKHPVPGRLGPIPAMIYVEGDGRGAPIWERWHISGPRDRPGYFRTTISGDQVDRLYARGKIKPEVLDDHGFVHAYSLA